MYFRSAHQSVLLPVCAVDREHALMCYKLSSAAERSLSAQAVWYVCTRLKHFQLENVAIANALQFEAARRRAVPLRFNFVARAKFEVAQPTRCRLRAFLLLIRYVTL